MNSFLIGTRAKQWTITALLLALCAVAFAQDREKDKDKDRQRNAAPQHRQAPQRERPAVAPERPAQPAPVRIEQDKPAVMPSRPAPPQVQRPTQIDRPIHNNPAPRGANPKSPPSVYPNAGGNPPSPTYPNAGGNRPSPTYPNAGGTPTYPNAGGNPPSSTYPNVGHPGNPAGVSVYGGQPDPSRGGVRFGHNAPPAEVRTPNGGMVHRSPTGSIREVHTSYGAVIRHAPNGVRRVEMVRPGGRVIVTNSHGHGYIQQPVVIGGHQFVQRTYVIGGVRYVQAYRPYRWGGVSLVIYTAPRYYSPGFYTWAYTPWVRPVRYRWGWMGSPWYAYWGGWFTPYPVYTSPALWLTDYLVAATLEEAYRERMEAAALASAPVAGPPLSPAVKDAIALEVRRQLDAARAEQQNLNMQPILFGGGADHVFVVSSALAVNSTEGECMLTEGDVLQLRGLPPLNADSADVVVLASKAMDCRQGSLAVVAIPDLQEMQNRMRATIDQGLVDLRTNQGQGGLPTLPPAAAVPAVNSAVAELPPDPTAGAELQQQAQQAGSAEQAVVSEAGNPPASGMPPSINLGQSVDEVVAIMGTPTQTVNLGSRQIYVYPNLKITFVDGKVADVQ